MFPHQVDILELTHEGFSQDNVPFPNFCNSAGYLLENLNYILTPYYYFVLAVYCTAPPVASNAFVLDWSTVQITGTSMGQRSHIDA